MKNKVKMICGIFVAVLFLVVLLPKLNRGTVYDARKLPSEFAVEEDERIAQEAGKEGFVTFGPYTAAEKGSIKVAVYYDTDTEGNWVDVFSNAKQITFGKEELSADVDRLVFTVQLTEDVEDLEVRTHYGGEGTLRVIKIVVYERVTDLYIFIGIYLTLIICIIFRLGGIKSMKEGKEQNAKNRICRVLNIKKNYWIIIWVFYLIINVIVSCYMQCAIITPDELNPLAISAKIAGLDWSMATSKYENYYGYTQSILYAPIFLIFDNGIIIYKIIIVLNSIIISFIPIISYDIVKKLFKISDPRIITLIVCVSCLQPAYLTLTKRAWNETTVIFLSWLIFYFICKLLIENYSVNKRKVISFFLGFFLALGYMTHGRFIALIISVFLLYIITFKKKYMNGFILWTTTLLFVFADKVIKENIIYKILWQQSNFNARNTMVDTLKKTIKNGFNLDVINDFFRGLNGNFFYINICSFGIVVLIFILCIKIFIYSKNKDNMTENILLIALFSLSNIIVSIVINTTFFLSDYHITGEYLFIYGRYTEYLIGPLFLLAFIIIEKYGINKYDVILCSSIYFINIFYTFLLENQTIYNSVWVHQNIMTLQSFAPDYDLTSNKINFLSTIIICFIITIIVLTCLIKLKKISMTLLCLVFFVSYYNSSVHSLIKNSRVSFNEIQKNYNILEDINKKSDLDKNYIIATYNMRPTSYQVALPYYKFYEITNSEIIRHDSYIITNGEMPQVEDMTEIYKVDEGDNLFIYGTGLANQLKSYGYRLYRNGYLFGNIIKFNTDSNQLLYILNGWHEREEWGMWSSQQESFVNIPLADETDNYVKCSIKMSVFHKDQLVEVFCNNIKIGEAFLEANSNNYDFIIPSYCIKDSNNIELCFKLKNKLYSPSDIDINSSDNRKLGVGLSEITLEIMN